jgi:ATP diphosphatase
MNEDKLTEALLSLSGLVSRLRGPEGCPWDIQQTASTVKMYFIEEAYEVLDALENGSADEVCQELGDLLFQIFFLADMAEDKGDFDLVDVVEEITEKMINRHPHVFGGTTVTSPEEVSENWEKIKRSERGDSGTGPSLLESVPIHLPALLRAHRLGEWASKIDPDFTNEDYLWGEAEKAFNDIRKAFSDRNKDLFGEGMGQLLFCLANLTRHFGLNAEHLLRDVNQAFLERFRKKG